MRNTTSFYSTEQRRETYSGKRSKSILPLPNVGVNITSELLLPYFVCSGRELWVPNGISATFGVETREGGDVVGQTGFVAVEIRNKKEG